jgi:NADH-quinone oxidoreductase chain G
MIKIEINNFIFFVKPNISLLEACELVGIDVPRFCFHSSLSIAGNCRMCLVEVAGSPKPVASCALPVSNNIKIFINSPLVKKARENVLEALLINHPLDCPICDQAGECDLQDQSRNFGSNLSRYFFTKRVVEDKNCGLLIKTIMTRCIHCTRCVRFNSEISGGEFFGTLNRGSHTEIGSYNAFESYSSELSGNVIDLCPVGALTSKTYAFKARPWELRVSESIDLSDAVGSGVFINFKETEIMRIFPKNSLEMANNIISDKARFSYDSNRFNRLIKPQNISKVDAQNLTNPSQTLFLTQSVLDLENLFFLKSLSNTKLKPVSFEHVPAFYKFAAYGVHKNKNFLVSRVFTSLREISLESKLCILISTNIKLEAALINSLIRFQVNSFNLPVFGFFQHFDNNFDLKFLNLNTINFFSLFESKMGYLSSLLIQFKKPIFIIGETLLKRAFNLNFFLTFFKNPFHTAIFLKVYSQANMEGISFLHVQGVYTRVIKKVQNIIAVDLEDSCGINKLIFNSVSKKLSWINTHKTEMSYTKAFTQLDSISFYPLTTFYEEEKFFLNLEHRFQKTAQIYKDKNVLGLKKTFKSFLGFSFASFYKSHLKYLTEMLNSSSQNIFKDDLIFLNSIIKSIYYLQSEYISNYPVKTVVEDFFLSTKYLHNSKNMLSCSQFFRIRANNFYKHKL